jgi:hypothetical protein
MYLWTQSNSIFLKFYKLPVFIIIVPQKEYCWTCLELKDTVLKAEVPLFHVLDPLEYIPANEGIEIEHNQFKIPYRTRLY